MALKAVFAGDVSKMSQVPASASLALCPATFNNCYRAGNDGGDGGPTAAFKITKFLVIGHRGSGMNALHSSDPRMWFMKENSIASFNSAGKSHIDFIEFDVQVTRDGCPIIFHDIFILTEDKGKIIERRVTELTLTEFLAYGPQKEPGIVGKPLSRRTKEGTIVDWRVEVDDALCTLEDAFQNVHNSLGFNIELKFDDDILYDERELVHIVQIVLKVVRENAKKRRIIISSFHPDAVRLIRRLQNEYPVFYLTNGGSETYLDPRRNSLEEAVKLCHEGGLQGIVSEAKAVFRNPEVVSRIKDSMLSLLSYGQLNNLPDAVHLQSLMGVDGVIVDHVKEVSLAVSATIRGDEDDDDNERAPFAEYQVDLLSELLRDFTGHSRG